MIDWKDILASRYRLGGRTVGEELDCAGVTMEVARRLGLCVADPWEQMREAYRNGTLDKVNGFPPCWRQIPVGSRLRCGDVLLWKAALPHAGIVAHGYLWSADATIGTTYARRIDRINIQPTQVWRHDSALCS